MSPVPRIQIPVPSPRSFDTAPAALWLPRDDIPARAPGPPAKAGHYLSFPDFCTCA